MSSISTGAKNWLTKYYEELECHIGYFFIHGPRGKVSLDRRLLLMSIINDTLSGVSGEPIVVNQYPISIVQSLWTVTVT